MPITDTIVSTLLKMHTHHTVLYVLLLIKYLKYTMIHFENYHNVMKPNLDTATLEE